MPPCQTLANLGGSTQRRKQPEIVLNCSVDHNDQSSQVLSPNQHFCDFLKIGGGDGCRMRAATMAGHSQTVGGPGVRADPKQKLRSSDHKVHTSQVLQPNPAFSAATPPLRSAYPQVRNVGAYISDRVGQGGDVVFVDRRVEKSPRLHGQRIGADGA